MRKLPALLLMLVATGVILISLHYHLTLPLSDDEVEAWPMLSPADSQHDSAVVIMLEQANENSVEEQENNETVAREAEGSGSGLPGCLDECLLSLTGDKFRQPLADME